APQHGAIFKGKDMVNKFINWVETLETGIDIMDDVYKIPTKRLTV
ncbi:MAG: MBL fold metallo-hydrolase, partial [Sulfurihydrogenibium azorense]